MNYPVTGSSQDLPDITKQTTRIEPPVPPPAPIGDQTDYDRAHSLTAENEKLKQEMAGMERQLTESVDDRRRLLRQLDYLGRVAGGFEQDHVVEDMPGKDEDHTSVLVEGHDDPNTWHRVEFHRQGPVAIASDQMRLIHAQLDQAHAQLSEARQQIEYGPPVDAVIIPAWADTSEIDNVGLVGAANGGFVVQRQGPYTPEEAAVLAAWLFCMADPHLDDIDAGFDYLVEEIRTS